MFVSCSCYPLTHNILILLFLLFSFFNTYFRVINGFVSCSCRVDPKRFVPLMGSCRVRVVFVSEGSGSCSCSCLRFS